MKSLILFAQISTYWVNRDKLVAQQICGLVVRTIAPIWQRWGFEAFISKWKYIFSTMRWEIYKIRKKQTLFYVY